MIVYIHVCAVVNSVHLVCVTIFGLLFSLTLTPLPPAKVQLDGIDRNPIVPSTRRNNIDKAVDFLRLDGVSLHADAFRGEAAHLFIRQQRTAHTMHMYVYVRMHTLAYL